MDNLDLQNEFSEPDSVTISKRKKKVTVYRKGTTYGTALIKKLVPFRPFMVQALKMKGVPVSGLRFKYVIALFHKNFVNGSDIDIDSFVNSPFFRVRLSDELNADFSEYRNQAQIQQIEQVVNDIIKRFIQAKEKYLYIKEIGENPKYTLSEIDLYFTKAVFYVQDKLQADEQLDSFAKKGNLSFIYLLIGILAIFIFLR